MAPSVEPSARLITGVPLTSLVVMVSSSQLIWYAGHLSERRIDARESLSGREQTVDSSLNVDDVELAAGFFAEGAYPQSGLDRSQPRPGVARVTNQPPDSAAAIISEQVDAVQIRYRAPPIDIATGNNAPLFVTEPGDGCHKRVTAPSGVARGPLHQIPAIVLSARTRRRLVVDFLVRRRPNVADPQVARDPIETKAPGVAQSKRPDLGARPRLVGVGVVGRDCVPEVVGHLVDVDAQDLAEQGPQILAILAVPATPVTQPDVEISILRPKEEQTTVVVRRRLVDEQDGFGARRVSAVRICARHPVSGDDGAAVAIGVVDENVSIVRVVGMEGDAEQPALPATADEVGDVQERLGHEPTIANDADAPRLLDDKEAAAAISRIDDLNWLIDAFGHELQAEVKDARVACRRARSPNQSESNRDEPHTHEERQHTRRLRTPRTRSASLWRRYAAAPLPVAPAGSCSDRVTRHGCYPPHPPLPPGKPRRRPGWAGPARTGARGRPVVGSAGRAAAPPVPALARLRPPALAAPGLAPDRPV